MQNVDTAPVNAPVRPAGNGQAAERIAYSLLDRALVSFMRWDGEKVAWAILLLVTILSRTIGLGDRAMSHDESLHTVYALKLFDGEGYRHDPMMHGPLKFHLTALAYFLFGVNDWSARIEVAVFGIAMVWLAWLLRPWIGKVGAFLVGLMFAISPALLYHSRYIRDEVMLCALLVLLAITVFRYLETRQHRWLYGAAVTLGLAFTTMEASFIFGGVFGGFLIVALAAELWRASWPASSRRYPFRLAVAVAGPMLVAGIFFLVMMTVAPGATLGGQAPAAGVAVTGTAAPAPTGINVFFLLGLLCVGIGATAALIATALALSSWGLKRLRVFPELDLIVLLFTLALPFLSGLVITVLSKAGVIAWKVDQFTTATVLTLDMFLVAGAVLAALFAVSILVGYYWLRNTWVYAAGLFWAITLLLFTTFLTNGMGVITGLIGSLGYWIAQQEVARGSQPWFFFFRLVPLYEFLPMLLAIGGFIAWLRGKAGQPVAAADLAAAPADGAGAAVKADGQNKVAGRTGLAAATEAPGLLDVRTLFVGFLVFWSVATWLVFTYVGEKMAWHVVYFATSMALLGGWWLGRVIDGIDWPAVRRRGGFWLMLMVPLFLVTLHTVIPPSGRQPFAGVSTIDLSNTAQWVLGLVAMLLLAYFLWERVTALGRDQSWRLTAVSLAAILAVGTVAVAYRFAFVDYDYATEPMVYAHGTPDLKLAMGQLDEISRKLVGDHTIKVAYDDDSVWPLDWYLRDYTQKVYFGATPNRTALDAPVVIVGDKNISKVKPYLGDRYYEFSYRLVWWPRETYRDLTFQKIWDGLRDPVQRGQFWNVVLYRRWTLPTSQWDPVHRFSMFVRKDVAAQVWDWGSPAPAAAATTQQDPYAAGKRDINAVLQLGTAETAGNAPGQFNFPRAVAAGPDGSIYVADSGNNRVQVFDAQGKFVRQWGSTCKLFEKTPVGCVGDGHGQFNEPWGIAVGSDGSVYVSDTWNHRVQKFDSRGNFLAVWGTFESTFGELGKPLAMYGPRAIAVGHDGNVYVTDTGNKRVQVFKPDGTFVAQFGGQGLDDGHFDEPVGLAQDGLNNWYVADTWNHRIQKFTGGAASYQYAAQWPINGWASQTVVNKPGIAIDATRGILYATDPENYRILAFGLDGTFKAQWGLFGSEADAFMLPTGIAVAPDGKVYVADGDSHRVMVFPPLQ